MLPVQGIACYFEWCERIGLVLAISPASMTHRINAAAAYFNPDAAFGRRVKNVLHSQTRMYVYFAGSKTQDALIKL